MNPLKRFIPAALAGALLLSLAACSTVRSRIQERPQAFEKLSTKDQALVASGNIRKGLGRDAVYIAWGTPDQRRLSSEGKHDLETWNYFGSWQETIPSYTVVYNRGYSGYCGYRAAPVAVFTPIYINHPFLYQFVTFEKEKVVAWSFASPQ